jgi:glycosyltransferase involved in cell wall biosynthesis
MDISVLITNYNYREYVVDAVESALTQSFPAYEIIVVDDNSTDGSTELLTQRYAQHPAVKLILLTENRGQLAALIRGTQAASGDVIALLDADDLYESEYLERLAHEYATRPQVDFISVNLRLFGARGRGCGPAESRMRTGAFRHLRSGVIRSRKGCLPQETL